MHVTEASGTFRFRLAGLALAAGWAMLGGCDDTTTRQAGEFIQPIEQAHNESAWDARREVRADFVLSVGDRPPMRGRMWTMTDVGRVRMEIDGGPTLVFDGSRAWVSPADVEFPRARFHLLTWPYFLAAPFKLDDPGTRIESLGELPLREGEPMPAAKLTFGEGVGDTPDDWYILYRDPQTRRLVAMAYIVTYGTPAEQAADEPHAIVYDGFKAVDGAVVSTDWQFYHWSRQTGIHGESMGRMKLRHVQFTQPTLLRYARPADAREDELPAGE